jgi:hypothetical protein
VIFLHPLSSDATTITNILRLFGEALGIQTNMTKSSATPIQCFDPVIVEI